MVSTSGINSQAFTPKVPKTAARRTSRFSPRPFSSPLGAVRNIGRPPVVLEWGSAVIRVGYAEQFQPQHIIPIPSEPFRKLEEYHKSDAQTEAESAWYEKSVSPIVRRVFDRLMIDPTTRRVVVVSLPYPPRAWETAIKAALWNLGVPAVAFLNVTDVVPLAQGWTRGLVVHVGADEAHLVAHVDGHPLNFTYQVVPCGYSALEDASKINCQWDKKMDKAWLDENNPNSLVVALLKCLKLAPLDARKDIIANLLVCGLGSVLVPDLGRRLALQVKSVLSKDIADAGESGSGSPSPFHEPAMTLVPMPTEHLKQLMPFVGLLSCAPYRADLIAWVGGSIYSTIWHRHDEEDKKLSWAFSPMTSSE